MAGNFEDALFDAFLEHATIKTAVQGLLKAANAVAKHPNVPKVVKKQLDGLQGMLKKTWAELSDDTAGSDNGGSDQTSASESAPIVSGVQTSTQGGEGDLRASQTIISEVIKHEGDKWVLYSMDGTKKLGEFNTEAEAIARENQIKALIHMNEAMKTEGGDQFPASDYAYVPDPDLPSTWKLRLTATPGGAPDAAIVGAAVAALGKGFRGQRVEIPAADRSKVIAKVRSAWIKANPDKSRDEMPPILKEAGDSGPIDFIEDGSIVELEFDETMGALVTSEGG